jgi:hypothetical protein
MSEYIKPKELPIPEEKYNSNNKSREMLGEIHYFTLTQDETDDEFTASVKTARNGFELMVCGKELNGCIIINLTNIDYPDPDSMVEAYLNVTYRENKNIVNDLSKGVATITLMRTAISFAFSYFKIDDLVLNDLSTFICSPIITVADDVVSNIKYPNNCEFSLPAFYILKYGKSWYQKHLNARIFNRELNKKLAKYKEFVSVKQDWDYLYNTYILPALQMYNKYLDCLDKDEDEEHEEAKTKAIEHIRSKLYNSWSKTDTYRDFILDVISDDNQYYYLIGWFDKIFNDIVHGGYYEDVDNVVLYEEFPFIEGLDVSYIKTTYWGKKEDEENPSIKNLHANEEYTTIFGGGPKNILFNKILHRRRKAKILVF